MSEAVNKSTPFPSSPSIFHQFSLLVLKLFERNIYIEENVSEIPVAKVSHFPIVEQKLMQS